MEENKEKVENKEESVKEAEVVTNNETVQEKKVNSYALASFICSLVGLLVCGLPLGIAAVITGGYALNSYKEEILKLLKIFDDNSKTGIVINDLQRSAIAYRLFQLVCFVFRLNKMTREDGLTSILRGFKKKELVEFSEELKFKKYKINWRWAFRYQWIISKI